MTKFEKDVYDGDELIERMTLEVTSEGTTVTAVDAKTGDKVILTFQKPSADALYELMSLARPIKNDGQPY